MSKDDKNSQILTDTDASGEAVIRRNAPLRQYKSPTLCKMCINISDFNCKKKYNIKFNNWNNFKIVTICTGYKEQVI